MLHLALVLWAMSKRRRWSKLLVALKLLVEQEGMIEVGVPPAAVLHGETFGDEWVLTIISLRGQRTKVPLASTSFSIPSSSSG
jgi:hypothetical protein